MALPIIAAAGIGAAASLWSGQKNRDAAKKANAEERAWNEKMFDKQNQRDIDFWKMQNAYNDPSAQMNRLGDAGLNPHLMYGSGSNAASGNASPIATHSAPSYTPRVQNYNEISQVGNLAANSLNLIYDIQQKKANIALTDAQAKATLANSANREFMNRFNTPEYEEAMKQALPRNAMSDMSYKQGSLDIQNLDRMTKEATTQTAREMAGLFENGERGANLFIQKYTQDLKNAVLLNDGMRYQNELKKLELDLNRKGIQKNDPIYMRIIGRILTDILGVDSIK